jgi:hypothetical protein
MVTEIMEMVTETVDIVTETMDIKVEVDTCDSSVIFSGYSGFLHQ